MLFLAGEITGFYQRALRELTPFFLGTHDPAHRLNLCAGVLDAHPVFKKLEDLTRVVHNWFTCSAARRLSFAEYQTKCSLPRNQFVQPAATRWLSQANAMAALEVQIPSLLLYTEDIMRNELPPDIVFMSRCLTDVHILLCIACFTVLLREMNVLVKILQTDGLYYADMADSIQQTLSSVRRNFIMPGSALADKVLFKNWHLLVTGSQEESPLKWSDSGKLVYSIQDVSGVCHEIDVLVEECPRGGRGRGVMVPIVRMSQFTEAVATATTAVREAAQLFVTDMMARFPSTPLIKAMSIMQPTFYKDGSNSFSEFNKHVDVLLEQYGRAKGGSPALVDMEALGAELSFVYDWLSHGCWDFQNAEDLWVHIDNNVSIRTRIPTFLGLVHILLSLPCSSCSNERRFSSMDYCATDKRNRLEGPHLAAVIRARSSHHTTTTLDTSTVFSTWLKAKSRRAINQ